MQVPVPAEYRQSARWVFNLDAGSFVFLVGGAALGFEILKSSGPFVPHLLEALPLMAVSTALALIRWPLDHGDKAMVWLLRGWNYYWRTRKGSTWGE